MIFEEFVQTTSLNSKLYCIDDEPKYGKDGKYIIYTHNDITYLAIKVIIDENEMYAVYKWPNYDATTIDENKKNISDTILEINRILRSAYEQINFKISECPLRDVGCILKYNGDKEESFQNENYTIIRWGSIITQILKHKTDEKWVITIFGHPYFCVKNEISAKQISQIIEYDCKKLFKARWKRLSGFFVKW